MSRSEYWPDIPDDRFDEFQQRLELVELLLDERVSLPDKREAKQAYRYAHKVSDRTIRRYLQLYRKKSARGLLFYRFPTHTAERIDDAALRAKLIELVHELPSRSIPQLRRLLAGNDAFARKIERVSDRTIYRFLQEHSLGKKDRIALEFHDGRSAYRSFEAPHSLALIQGDARDGIWLTGPDGTTFKTYLFLWIDDYSRKILFGKYYASEKLPRMEDSFKYAVLRYGIPNKAYLDNGKVYISKHFAFVLEKLGCKKIHHPPYQAHCKGKIEAQMKIIKHEFQDEAQRAGMHTLDELNTAFWAWSELSFNKRIHSATGQTPDKRFVAGLPADHRRIEDLSWFLSLFLWRENRKVSKYGKIKLHGNEYPVTRKPANTVVQARFDPCDLREVYLYDQNETFLESTWPSKQRTITVPGIPEERKDAQGSISEASRKLFSDLRERYLKTRNETNQVDFSHFYRPKEDPPHE
jgi:transposase InsO family protein